MSKILIVEDDRAIARIERDYLERNGFSVTLEEDGKAGCAEALKGEYDLVLLDVMLPGMDGFSICQRLRESLDIPILLVNLAQYARLRQGGGTVLTSGELRLDTRSRRVTVAGREVELKNKEYELLCFFLRNPGVVFDRETLYERVWGMEAMGDNATVAVHINRLREKLEDDPAQPKYIQTVRGAGYRMAAPAAK